MGMMTRGWVWSGEGPRHGMIRSIVLLRKEGGSIAPGGSMMGGIGQGRGEEDVFACAGVDPAGGGTCLLSRHYDRIRKARSYRREKPQRRTAACLLLRHYDRIREARSDGELPLTTTATTMATEAFRFWSLSAAGGGATDFEMSCRGRGNSSAGPSGGMVRLWRRIAMPDASIPRTDALRDWTAVSSLPSSAAAAAVR